MVLSDYTRSLLDDIEKRIDPEAEEKYMDDWRRFWYGESGDIIFTPHREKTSLPGVKFQPIHLNDALHDRELMLDMQLHDLSNRLSSPSASLGIRANYGTGIMTSLFGAEVFEMPRETECLPTTRSFNDSDAVREILERGLPDLNGGYGADVFAFGEMCAEIFEDYPKIKKYVQVYHPDTQGPLDVAELLWGGEMFYEMYDDPDFVHGVLRLITDTYKAFMEKWYTIIPKYGDLSVHWGIVHQGTLMLRLDSAMNLSPEFYEEYSKPYDRELFEHFGGGCMHYCGRGDHYIDSLCDIESMYAFNMSQPELNDMDKIMNAVLRKNKRIIALPRAAEFVDRPGMRPSMVHA